MIQKDYSRLWDGYETDKDALKARNAEMKKLRSQGYIVKGWTLPNQLKPYDSLGHPNGGICNVYMINIKE